MSLLWADVQTTEADFPILTELGGPPGRTEVSNIHVVRMGPGYRPERPKYRPLRGRPSCRSEDSVTQVKSTVHVWSLAFSFHKFNPVHMNQIHSRPRLVMHSSDLSFLDIFTLISQSQRPKRRMGALL